MVIFMKKQDEKTKRKLEILKHTRPRDIMPRPTTFEDKSKFKRSRQKTLDRKIIKDE